MGILKYHSFSVEFTPPGVNNVFFLNYVCKKKEIPFRWYKPSLGLTSIKILRIYPGRSIQLGEDSFRGVSIKRRVIKYRYRRIRCPA